MSGIRLKADLKALKKTADVVKKFADDAEKAENIPEIIAGVMESGTLERFIQEKAPSGDKWKKPIAGGKALTKSGRMRDSIQAIAYPNRVVIGTNVKYSAIHQFGGEIKAKMKEYLHFRIGNTWSKKKSVTIPARPYLGISDSDNQRIVKNLEAYWKRMLKQ